ncbi:MAG: helix-turn-helix domain-containing protein, partial [Ruminococcus sp.]|nr:helix-turn-helix domain-containing protein [Ruminococcus sp.]
EERKAIEMMYRQNMGAEEIASKLEISAATIYRELQRGNTHITDINGRSGYSAVLAQNRLEYNRQVRAKRRAAAPYESKTNKSVRYIIY